MTKKKMSRSAAGPKRDNPYDKHIVAHRRHLYKCLRESAIKGAFGCSVLAFLCGGAGLDYNPVSSGIVMAVSFVAASAIYFANDGWRS